MSQDSNVTSSTPIKKRKPSRKKIGVQKNTIDNVADKVLAAQSAETKEYKVQQIPLANIEFWKDQPRSSHLTKEDLYKGSIDKNDEFFQEKNEELEGIIGLALSIADFGIINDPVVYALPGKNVSLLGGHRRTMAVIFGLFHIKKSFDEADNVVVCDIEINPEPDLSLLETTQIDVKIFQRKLDKLTIERLGMADNAHRKDLPIKDKLVWLVRFSDIKESMGGVVQWRDLIDTIDLKRSQAYEWVKVAHNRKNTWIEKTIHHVIQEELPLNKLIELASIDEKEREALYKSWFKKRPTSDKPKKVSLGVSTNFSAIKSLVMKNIGDEHQEIFDKYDWEKQKDVKKAFSDFLQIWESQHE